MTKPGFFEEMLLSCAKAQANFYARTRGLNAPYKLTDAMAEDIQHDCEADARRDAQEQRRDAE